MQQSHLNNLTIIPITPNQIQRINAKAHTANMQRKINKNKVLLNLLNKLKSSMKRLK